MGNAHQNLLLRLATLAAAIGAGCTSSRGQSLEGVHHPSAAYLVHPIQPTGEITMPVWDTGTRAARVGDTLHGVPKALRPLFSSDPSTVVSVGAPEARLGKVLGEIRSVAVDSSGRLYVLDGGINQILVFDQQGRLLQSIGNLGPGRPAFVRAQSIALDEAGRLYVGDLARQVHVFVPSSQGLQYSKSLRLNVAALSMCIMNSRLYVHGITLGTGMGGEYLSAWGGCGESIEKQVG